MFAGGRRLFLAGYIVEQEVTSIMHFPIQASNFAELLISTRCLLNVF